MKIYADVLSAGLRAVARSVGGKESTLPVLRHVLLKDDAGELTLTTTDLASVSSTLLQGKADSASNFSVSVPFQTLSDLAAEFGDELLDLSLVSPAEMLRVVCGKNRAQINGFPASEFPSVHRFDVEKSSVSLTLSGREFSRVFDTVLSAAPKGKFSGIGVEGVLMSFSGSEMKIEATDGHQHATYSLPLVKPATDPVDVVLLPGDLANVSKVVGRVDLDVVVVLDLGTNRVSFEQGNWRYSTSLLASRFPDTSQLNSVPIKTTLVLPMAEVQAATARAKAIDAERVLLTGSNGDGGYNLTFTAKTEGDVKGSPIRESSTPILVKETSDLPGDIEVVLGTSLLLRSLHGISMSGSPDVELRYSGPESATFWCVPDLGDQYRLAVMPMHRN